MGLDKLKSIFTEGISKFNKTDIRSFNSDLDNINSSFITSGPGGTSNVNQSWVSTNLISITNNSIFNDGIGQIADAFDSNRPQNMNDSKLANHLGSHIPQTYAFSVDLPEPTLDTLLRGRIYPHPRFAQYNPADSKLFISEDSGFTTFYKGEIFDPRPEKNSGISITQNGYQGSILNYRGNTNRVSRFGIPAHDGFINTGYPFIVQPFIPVSSPASSHLNLK